jgi:hypothetical protein
LLKILGFWAYLFGPALGISLGIPLVFSKKTNWRLLGIAFIVLGLGPVGIWYYIATSSGGLFFDLKDVSWLSLCVLWSCLEGFFSRQWNEKFSRLAAATSSRCLNAMVVFYATICILFAGI